MACMRLSFRRHHWTIVKRLFLVGWLLLILQFVYLQSMAAIKTNTVVKKSADLNYQNQTKVTVTIDTRLLPILQKLQQKPAKCNKRRSKRGFLTVGIPTIMRPNTDQLYLLVTLGSLLGSIPANEYENVTVVVMVSDDNDTYNIDVTNQIYNKFPKQCEDGFIHVIKTNKTFYPNFKTVKRTFKDSQPRLEWRAKQNWDFGLLMLYSRNISEYYIQLEDDVIAARNFVEDVRLTISKTDEEWFLLEFSRLGFIGKMFHSYDLTFAARFLIDNFQEAPCDLLLGAMRVSYGQEKPIHIKNSLFQHIGRFSSLKNKLMPSLDNTFKDSLLNTSYLFTLPEGDNPPATIISSLQPWGNYTPEMAYDGDNTTFFWAITPSKGMHFTMIFTKPHNFSRIMVSTGEFGTKRDSFLFCDLLYSVAESKDDQMVDTGDTSEECGGKFNSLVSLVDGDTDTLAQGTDIPHNIKCLRLSATKSLKHWVIIRDIQLFF